MTTTTTVTVHHLTAQTDLHCWYPSQTSPQPCHISLDLESGELTAGYNPEVGPPYAIPASVYHRRILCIEIPCLTADAANALMDEVTPIAQRVLAGATIAWDGNNHIGVLDAEAGAAYDEFAAAIERYVDDPFVATVNTLDAADWYAGGDDPTDELGITADTTDEQLPEIERAAEADIKQNATGVVVVRGLPGYLRGLRDDAREAVRDKLQDTAAELEQLTELRSALIRQIKRWGDSDRAIAELADLSHTHVQRIVAAYPVVAD